ncbi:MAG: ABC transporter permease [Planctomycetaceae bacterium]
MNAWQITKKDLRLLVRDRRTLFVLIALPLAFITILGFSAGQLFSEKEKARKFRLGVVNEDESDVAGKLLTEVYRLNALEVTEVADRAVGRQKLRDGEIEVLVAIGPRYHELVEQLDLGDLFYAAEGRLAGKLESLDIQVQAGPLLANAAEIVQELVFAFALRTIAPDVLKSKEPDLAKRLFLKAKQSARGREGAAASSDTGSVDSPTRADVIYQYLVPSYTVMFVFFIVNFMARSLIIEHDTGTLNRLRIAPLTRAGLMLGKTTPFLLMSLMQTALLFIAGRILFRMSWGAHPFMLLPVMVCTSLAATTLGLLVATLVRTDSQVSAYGNFLVLTMAGISGCLMPRSWQPQLMQEIGKITPHAWALIAYDELLNRDLPELTHVWNCCAVLLTFAAGFFIIGWWRFRRLD